jgi:hypothetical protein
MMETEILGAILTGALGLAGVLVGARIALAGQREERRNAWLRRQLDEFYSLMLGYRLRILARSQSREKVSNAAGSAWAKIFEGEQRPQQLIELQKRHEEEFDKIIKYDNKMLHEEILPLYRRMIDHFSSNLGLAEPETRKHFGELVHFMDIWDRSESDALPGEVLKELGQDEKKLYAFYDDLAANVQRIQDKLRGGPRQPELSAPNRSAVPWYSRLRAWVRSAMDRGARRMRLTKST